MEAVVDKAKVFVSYSRHDLDFADQLVLALADKGFEPMLDRHNIDAAENWRDRLSSLIASCDTIVFVLSAASAVSDICLWEIEEAERQGKRMIPVVPESLRETVVPSQLAVLNYIHFFKNPTLPGSGFYDGVQKLERALRLDLHWIRHQTRLWEQARDWEQTRSADRLLRGEVLQHALQWQSEARAGITVLPIVREFLSESDNADRLRRAEVSAQIAEREAAVQKLSRRTTIGIGFAGTLTAAASGLAWWGNDAERRFKSERDRAILAEAQSVERQISEAAARTDLLGQMLAFAASPGQFASDGPPGENSPYTAAVLEALRDRNKSLLQALLITGAVVSENSGTKQRPYLATDINGDLYLPRMSAAWQKKALCISVDRVQGLEDYRLANVKRDATAWTNFLTACGFEVSELANPTAEAVNNSLDKLTSFRNVVEQRGQNGVGGARIIPAGFAREQGTTGPDATIAFVFYSGTGFTESGEMSLAADDTELVFDENKSMNGASIFNAIGLDKLQEHLRSRAAVSVLALDTNFNRLGPSSLDR